MADEPPRADYRPIMAGLPADDGPRSDAALASRGPVRIGAFSCYFGDRYARDEVTTGDPVDVLIAGGRDSAVLEPHGSSPTERPPR
jgi:hypothetical protein